MILNSQRGSNNHCSSSLRWRRLLHGAGLTDQAIDRAMIRGDDNGWLYPIVPRSGYVRRKAYDSNSKKKYSWPRGKPAQVGLYDPVGDLAQHIAAAGDRVILATGEKDVWSCFSAGVYNVTCTLDGENTVRPTLGDELRDKGAAHVVVWPDRDSTGTMWASKVQEVVHGTGLDFEARALPYRIDSKADINTCLRDVGAEKLYDTLMNCALVDLPQPEPKRPRQLAPTRRDLPALSGAEWEAYQDAVERAAIEEWHISSANGNGFSRNFSCPFHEDQNPSAAWNFNTHGVHCHACGSHNTHEVAAKLGLPSWADHKAEHKSAAPVARTTPAKPTRFPHGLPYTLRKRMNNAHYRGNVKSQHPAAIVWSVWQELHEELPNDWIGTANGFQAATKAIGRNLSRETSKRGLEQLEAWGIVELCEFCNLPTQEKQVVRSQKSQKSATAKTPKNTKKSKAAKKTQDASKPKDTPKPRRGRPGKLYRFRPVEQQLAYFERHYKYLLHEHAFHGVPSDVQAEYGSLSAEIVQLLDELRAPTYAEYADEREKAQERLGLNAGYLEGDVARVKAGRYDPATLPPGPIPNAAAYRRLLHKSLVPEDGSARENAYRDQFEIGASRSTLSRIRTENGVITVPRTREIPLDRVTDYQREHGLVLSERGNTAIVRAPSAEKFADLADGYERAAYESLRERQKAIRARSSASGSQVKSGQQQKPATIPLAYSEQHVREQFEFTPGTDAISPFDERTGEVCSLSELWQALAKRKDATPQEDDTMIFSALSEPREPDIELDEMQDEPVVTSQEPEVVTDVQDVRAEAEAKAHLYVMRHGQLYVAASNWRLIVPTEGMRRDPFWQYEVAAYDALYEAVARREKP